MSNYLLDKDFLDRIDNDRNRIVYVKLISLDFDENPQEEILGRITSGSINVDGNSSVRRTCSLSLIANELDINQYYWGLKTKFKCFIGLENRIDNHYPNPIWFPMGTFLITSFSCNEALANYTISISGKDKMCLLNGDIGGTITAISVNFGEMSEQQKDGSIVKTKLLLKDIIREGVHEYAREPYKNIVVNDLDEAALELLEYRGTNTMYIIMQNETGAVLQYSFDPNTKYYYQTKPINENSSQAIQAQIEELENRYWIEVGALPQMNPMEHQEEVERITERYDELWNPLKEKLNDITQYGCIYEQIQIGDMTDKQYDHRVELGLDKSLNPLRLFPQKRVYDEDDAVYNTVIKVECGETIGYRLTTLTYAGDLIASIGENFTSVLDKIKNMLGDYEYFYNLEGQFVWQRRPTYINISWNNIVQNPEEEAYAENAAYTSAITYSFENGNLITAIQHQPDIQNVKNDYSVFGVRKTTSGTEVPVHIRYAIDQKPTFYKSWNGKIYSTQVIPKQKIFEMAEGDAELEYLMSVLNYPKQPLPDGLSDDWWDIWDWGEYYKQLTGEYPPGNMSLYATAGTQIDLENLFTVVPALPERITRINDNGQEVVVGSISPGTWKNPSKAVCFLFDTLTIDNATYLCFTGHNPGTGHWSVQQSCGHQYNSYFMDLYRKTREYNERHPEHNYEFHSYFYKPKIPLDVQVLIDQKINEIMKDFVYDIVDWREIIWRMADDYMKHSMKDSKYELNPNNFELAENLTEADFQRENFYIRKDKYIQADRYYSTTTYYIYNSNNGTFEEVNQEITPLSQANFDYRNIDLINRVFYYYKEATPEYVLATDFEENTEYYRYIDFLDRIRTYNADYYPDGITGYEQYYTDIKSFWRDLYDPDYIQGFKVASVNDHLIKTEGEKYYWLKNQEKEQYQPNTIYYTSDLYGTWRAHSLTLITKQEFENHPDLYFLPIQQKSTYQKAEINEYTVNTYYVEVKPGEFELSQDPYNDKTIYYTLNPNAPAEDDDDYIYDKYRTYYTIEEKQYYSEYEDDEINGISAEDLKAQDDRELENGLVRTRQYPNRFWNKKIWETPEKLDFWFDFLDTEGELSQFSVKRIGDRPKTENNTNIKAVYYRDTPNAIFVNNEDEKEELKKTKPGYTFLSLNNDVNHLFTISSQGQSCKDKLNSMLYDYAVCKQNITLTTIPIYYLQPNTRIFITDLESGINGEYIISRLGYNLTYNGTLSITASKAVDRIY